NAFLRGGVAAAYRAAAGGCEARRRTGALPLAPAAFLAENGPPDHPAGKQPWGLFSDPPPIPGARKPRDIWGKMEEVEAVRGCGRVRCVRSTGGGGPWGSVSRRAAALGETGRLHFRASASPQIFGVR